jgi:broad-specificity NMP kinase
MVIVQLVKRKVVVEHHVLHLFQHVDVIVVQILQQQHQFLVEVVERA